MELEGPTLIALGFFFLVATVTKVTSDNATKRRLIEARVSEDVVRALFRKGYDPELFSALKWGLVLLLVGAGMVTVDLLPVRDSKGVGFGTLLLCAGLGLLGYYMVATRVLKIDPRRTDADTRADRLPDV